MNIRKLIFKTVIVLIPILLTLLVTSCFNKENNNVSENKKYSWDEYISTSDIIPVDNPVFLKCWEKEVWYIKNYSDLKKTKLTLLTNTKIFKDELDNQIHFKEITNPVVNNINHKKFFIYAYWDGLSFLWKDILEINKNNASDILYINEWNWKIQLTKKWIDEIKKWIDNLNLKKKEDGKISIKEDGKIEVIWWVDWYKVILNLKDLEKTLDLFYKRNDCSSDWNEYELKSVQDKTELKEWWNHWLNEIVGQYSMAFTKSKKESVTNIETISWLVDWKIIKPGEEFDLWDIIYSFWMTNYELSKVIKWNKIETEFWWGLCWYATTLYRTALYSWLDITKRYPHSIYTNDIYWKKELWLDSAIYLWGKNLKFKNNTGKYIYISSKFIPNEKKVSVTIYWTKRYNSIVMDWPIINKDNKKEVTWYRIRDWEKEEIKSIYNQIH